MSAHLQQQQQQQPQSPTSIPPSAQIIHAPDRPPMTGLARIFLAGSTDCADWRGPLAARLARLPVTILNPLQPAWDGSWAEDPADARFERQVRWELEMAEAADLVVVYFAPGTLAPVSMLELGLAARGRRAVVFCPAGFAGKRGNVLVAARVLGLELCAGWDEVVAVVEARVAALLGARAPAPAGREKADAPLEV